MNTKQTLIALLNTLSQISVKGNDAKLMAACLNTTEELVQHTANLENKVAELEAELEKLKQKKNK